MKIPRGPATVMGAAHPIATGQAGKVDALRARRREVVTSGEGALSQETCPGAKDPSPRGTGAQGRAVRDPGATSTLRRGHFDSGAKDATIEC